MSKSILGVKIDDVNMEEAVNIVERWLLGSDHHFIVTPNPEFLISAQKDPEFKKILNDADLSIPDGVGLKLGGVKNTVAGTDLMEKLVELAAKKGYKVGLLGGRDGVAKLCAERLSRKYPNLKISFAETGPVIARSEATKQSNSLKRLPRSPASPDSLAMTNGCDILFVAFGPPKQEKWIAKNLPILSVKVAMGVGGAFDFLSGKIPRAPNWMRILGLEWLFRLIVQPWRIKRQLRLVKFLFAMLTRSV